jgi:hypothetical protein
VFAGLRAESNVLHDGLSAFLYSQKQDMLRKRKLSCEPGLLPGPPCVLSKPEPDMLREHILQLGPDLLQ